MWREELNMAEKEGKKNAGKGGCQAHGSLGSPVKKKFFQTAAVSEWGFFSSKFLTQAVQYLFKNK